MSEPTVLYAVFSRRGPQWDHGRGLREQRGWDEHAEFMDELTAAGFVRIGGPLADGTVLLVCEGENEEEVRSRLAADPWPEEMLARERIVPWEVLLRSDAATEI